MDLQLHDPAFLAVASGGTPALDLFFSATKALDSRITFTRGSTGTFINSSGLVETASAGVARFTHDPVTLASLGLLIEESRINSLLNSATLSTQNVTVTATPYTLSFTGTGSITRSGTSTGTLTGTGDGEANRVAVTFTPTAGTLTLTVSGTVTNAQLEAGSFRTSYIPTTGSPATRAADVATMTGTNFSSWYNQTEGTIVASATAANASTATVLTIDDGSINNRIYIQRESSSSIARGIVTTSGSAVAQMGTAGISTSFSSALAYKQNDFAFSALGSSVVTDTSGNLPTVDRLRIGAAPVSGFGAFGPIARIRYFRRRLPNANLQTLTT